MPPPHKKRWYPTEDEIRQIGALAGYGMREDQISNILGVSESTFQLACKRRDGELRQVLLKGREKANAAVQQTLFKMATSGKCPAATIFWSKVRMRWKEPAQSIEFPDKDGRPQPLVSAAPPQVILTMPRNGKEADNGD